MRSVGVALIALGVPALASAAPCIWFADATSIKQVDTTTNSIVAEAPLPAPRRLVMNETDCGVWALRNKHGRLIKFDSGGNEIRNLRLSELDPQLTEVLRIRLDPFDDSLWVTGERRITHLDSDASRVRASFNAPGEIRRFRIGMDQKLWVLGKRKLWRFNRKGALLEERPLDEVLRGESRYFVVDELRETIWVAGQTQVARMSSVTYEPPVIVATVEEGITGFALDPITGRVWFGKQTSIEALNTDGTPFARVDLAAQGLSGLHKLRFDPASRSLWAGFSQQIVRFSDTGDLVAILPAVDYDDEAIGVPPFKVKPRLVLHRPPESGIVNRARPLFELEYRARCNGHRCDVPLSYFSSMQLVATLNGVEVGSDFQFDPDTNKATFRPAARLPEGVSTFAARLRDVFGHRSNPVDTAFTVDTIAPAFGPITPPAGTVLPTPQVTLQGSINEVGASVILENAQALNPLGPNPQMPQPPGFSFSWGLTLLPGSNSVQLSAIDPAGNVASVVHTLAFSGAPQIVIQSPIGGSTVDDDNVTVSGTWSGPPNTGITVNGLVAAISGNQYFAQVPLALGSNTIVVTATGADGSKASSTVHVTSSGASTTRVTGSPLQGLAPLTVNFAVTSDRPIQSIDGNFAVGYEVCTEGCYEPGVFYSSPGEPLLFVYEESGAYEARFNVVHADGSTVTKTTRIVVLDQQGLDQQLRLVWGGLTSALSRGDKIAAMQYLNAQAKETYGPVFDALLPNMAQILVGFSPLHTMAIEHAMGSYAVNRNIDGVERVFFIYFLRDGDGVWRLDSM